MDEVEFHAPPRESKSKRWLSFHPFSGFFFRKSRLCRSVGGQSEGKDEEKKQDEANTEDVKRSVEVGSPSGFVSCIVKSKQVSGSIKSKEQ